MALRNPEDEEREARRKAAEAQAQAAKAQAEYYGKAAKKIEREEEEENRQTQIRGREEAEAENKRIEEQRKYDQSLLGKIGNKAKAIGEAHSAAEDAFVRGATNIVIKAGTSSRFWAGFILVLFFGGFLLWRYGYLKATVLRIMQFTLFLLFALLFYFGVRTAVKSQDKEEKTAATFIVLVFIVWVIDLIPAGLPLIGDWLGPPYAGFKFDFSGILSTNWIAVITSSIVFLFLIFSMFYDLARKHPVRFLINLCGFLAVNQAVNYFNFFGLGNSFNTSYINYIFLGIIIIALVGLFLLRKKFHGTDLADYPTWIFMLLVFSFFWVNIGWVKNLRAFFHVLFILAFGFGYVARREKENPAFWHLLIPGLLIMDFYGYGLLWNYGLDVFRFIPVLVLFVLFYCYTKTNSTYALVSLVFVFGIFLIFTIQTLGVDATSIPFEAARGADYKDFYSQFKDKVKEIIEGRLDIATAGLYRGSVEKNRYESLGVYFGNIRAADPRFYTDEPITVWGTLRSKTYKDAVIINFSCYRWKDNKRIRADKIIPDILFPIFTLEEVDTECTFPPKKENPIPAGANIVTLSAEYNFGTDAYLKTYFMDRERFRANAREDIDPLTQFGIKEKNPAAVHTNGPVEIGISAGPLVTVSEGYAVKPAIGITLTNRKEIQDKDKKIISKWDGKIRNITELVLLTPPGITLGPEENLKKCSSKDQAEQIKCPCSMPFDKYDINKCYTSCDINVRGTCSKACDSVSGGRSDIKTSCNAECATANTKCLEECTFLFEGEGSNEKYNAYALDVSSLKFKDLNKDIDKHRSFVCRFEPSPSVLDETPITTRYFRVRARYNYVVENSVTVNVERLPVETINAVPEGLFKTALDFKPGHSLWFEGFNPELIAGIASTESRFRHCCQDATKNRASNCIDSSQKDCPFENLITSGSSFGIMQIKYNTEESKKWIDSLSAKHCGDAKITNYDCNVKVGIAILKSKYDIYKDGCKSTPEYKSQDRVKYKTFIDGCENGISSSNVRYDSYKGIEAAIRGYNGWGRDSRFDVNYVDKVVRASKTISGVQIIDPTTLAGITRQGDGMSYAAPEQAEEASTSGSKPYSPLNIQISFDYLKRDKVTVTWEKSLTPDVINYKLTRSSDDGVYTICDRSAGTDKYTCEDTNPFSSGRIYTYTVYAYSSNGEFSQSSKQLSMP